VPLFIGFVTTGVPLGVTFSFLVSAPMVNEVALVLLFGLFGWKVAGLYLGTGLLIAMISGWAIGRLRMEKHVEDWVFQTPTGNGIADEQLDWPARIRQGVDAVKDIVGRVWLYVLLGIAVGAGIHGYVPENFMASIMGKGAWWSVPLAVVIGVPMYSNAAGIIPVVQALLGKGAVVGLPVLCAVRSCGDELCADRWRVAGFQLPDHPGRVRQVSRRLADGAAC